MIFLPLLLEWLGESGMEEQREEDAEQSGEEKKVSENWERKIVDIIGI